MANEQTSVPLYAASEVLTAANMNISAGTGVPVFATTVTRDAAFGGASEKVLAEGQLCYLSASNIVQYYDGAAWATVGPAAAASSGLVCVKAETSFSAASTINVNNVFSATYTNYLVNIVFDTSATIDINMRLRVGGVDNSTAASYKRQQLVADGGTVSGFRGDGDSFLLGAGSTTAPNIIQVNIFQPFAADETPIMSNNMRSTTSGTMFLNWAFHNQTVSYDGFSLLTSSGTTTGTYTVFAYSKTV